MFQYLEGCTRAKHHQQIFAAAPVMSELQRGESGRSGTRLHINFCTMIQEALHDTRVTPLAGYV